MDRGSWQESHISARCAAPGGMEIFHPTRPQKKRVRMGHPNACGWKRIGYYGWATCLPAYLLAALGGSTYTSPYGIETGLRAVRFRIRHGSKLLRTRQRRDQAA